MKLLLTAVIIAGLWAGTGYIIVNSDKNSGVFSGVISSIKIRNRAESKDPSARYSPSGGKELRELNAEDGKSFSKTSFIDYTKRASSTKEETTAQARPVVRSGPVAHHNPQMRIDPGIRVERNAAQKNSCPYAK